MAKQVQIPPLDERQRYSIPEAAALLRMSKSRLYEELEDGRVKSFKDGARRYIHGSEIIKRSAPPVDGGSAQ